MQLLHSIPTTQLVDLLAKYTYDYTKMLSSGVADEEYEKCKSTIKALQAEIELRKTGDTTNVTTVPDFIVT